MSWFSFLGDILYTVVSVPLKCQGRESARSEDGELVGL